ncbi:hypothetical protein QN277_011647 [Acacia crassicarpa]|uniref:Reverse transcriptase domain-containing protein n=1 Tax=Acacia crassicarpa TaxID=499986 RepID=A0AAE1MZ43_9FABA|nr:hypothetical protein QN277_011647 [Acacia crassicarpa]
MECVTSTTYNVLWNGERTDFFVPKRGIRQDDPISPYLFVLCMERLSHVICDSVTANNWRPIRVTRVGPSISHLMFADDLLLFGELQLSKQNVLWGALTLFVELPGKR